MRRLSLNSLADGKLLAEGLAEFDLQALSLKELGTDTDGTTIALTAYCLLLALLLLAPLLLLGCQLVPNLPS